METIDTGPSCPTDYAALRSGMTEAEWREEAHAEALALTASHVAMRSWDVRGIGSVLQIAAGGRLGGRSDEWRHGATSTLFLVFGIEHDRTAAAIERLSASWPGC